MAVRDNIAGGESYFVAEIKSMKRILSSLDRGNECYCFIDEILKGTNTVERVSAATAVLKYLSLKDCICIAATHDIELTELLKSEYTNNHFREQMESDGVHFDYKLKPGLSNTRNAIKLLSYYGFPKTITEEANSIVKKMEQG